MNTQLDVTLQTRKILFKILNNTSREDLLTIPDGFRNNIWWNIAHVVVTQQLLVYKNSGLSMKISQELVDKYRKGTVPEGVPTDEDIDEVSGFLYATIEWTMEDLENGLFKEYNEYPTSAGVTLKNFDDATTFNLFHEGLHLGAILSLKKALMK